MVRKLILIGLIPSYKLDEIEQVLLLKSRINQVESYKNITILVLHDQINGIIQIEFDLYDRVYEA